MLLAVALQRSVALNCCRTQCALYFSKQVPGSCTKRALLCKAREVCDRHHQRRPGTAGDLPSTKRPALVARLDVRDSFASHREAEPSSNVFGCRREALLLCSSVSHLMPATKTMRSRSLPGKKQN